MVAKMRMIRWMCGYIKLDRMGNVVLKEKAKVAPTEGKMRETPLRWSGHIKRSVDALVRRCETIKLMYWRGRLKTS